MVEYCDECGKAGKRAEATKRWRRMSARAARRWLAKDEQEEIARTICFPFPDFGGLEKILEVNFLVSLPIS